MKETNPIVPPGMNFKGGKRGRLNMRMAVIVVVLLHIGFFSVILLHGCKQKGEDETTATEMAQIVDVKPQPTPPLLPESSTPTPPPLPELPANPGLPPLPLTAEAFPPSVSASGTASDPAGLLPAPVTPLVQPAPQSLLSLGSTEHVVVSGDSFWTIGRKYGLSSSAIERANPNVIPTRMKIGQKITIPAKSVLPPAPDPVDDDASYTVKSGDTLGHIALKHGVKVGDLKVANPNVIPTRMKIGQKLKLPAGTDRSTRAPAAGLPAFPGSGTGASPPVDPVTGLPILPLPPGAPSPTP
jgi:LysM repeat protein